MIRPRKFGLSGALLLVSVCSTAQEKPAEIKLTIKLNDQTVPDPYHISFSAGGYVANVTVTNGRFRAPAEISRAKTWCFTAIIPRNKIQIVDLSQIDFAYENWTLYMADRRYKGNYASAVPKGTEIRSSCMLVLESVHVDPGATIFQTHCRSKG